MENGHSKVASDGNFFIPGTDLFDFQEENIPVRLSGGRFQEPPGEIGIGFGCEISEGIELKAHIPIGIDDSAKKNRCSQYQGERQRGFFEEEKRPGRD